MFAPLIAILALALTAFPALGRVTDVYAPSTAVAGENITVVLGSEGYIQNYNDYGVIWALKDPAYPSCGNCVGVQIGYESLYGITELGHVANTSFQVAIPDFQQGGEYLFVAAIPHLVGALGTVSFRFWNSSISITVPSS